MSVRTPGQFFKTAGWQKLRLQRLAFSGNSCECCGSRERLQLDHVEPRSVTGDRRRLGLNDVQILCSSCNGRKGGMPLRAPELRDLLGIDPRQAMAQPRTIFTRRLPRIG